MALVCTHCPYTRIHGSLPASSQRYCPECGTVLETVADPAVIQPANRMARFGGIFLDWLIFWPFDLLSEIPIAGPLIIISLWLFRDINGRSLGKVIVGTTIISRHGGPSTPMQRVIRNFPFALSLLPLFIPVIGLAAFFLQFLMVIAEFITVLATGERIGDKLAGTMVVKRSSAAIAQRSISSTYEM